MQQLHLHSSRSSVPLGLEENPVEVRRATPADLRSVARLFDDYRMFYGRTSNRRAARAFVSERLSRGESVILLARARPRVASARAHADVGFAQLYRSFSSVHMAPTLVLNDLFVVPAARRLGVGGILVDACTVLARRERALSLHLETHPDNEAAMRLYARKGFVADTEYARLSLQLGAQGSRRSVAR